jgi:hypothetical protein
MQDAGATYIFERDGAGIWSQKAYLKASNTDAGDLFGSSVTISGDTVVVGAPHEDSLATGINGDQADNLGFNSGAVYVFVRDTNGTWSQRAYIKASNTDVEDYFGEGLGISGNTLVVSAPREDSASTGVNGDQFDNSATNAGAAYVFIRDEKGLWSQKVYVKASNTDSPDTFGSSIGVFGATVAIGAVREQSAATGLNGDQLDNTATQAGAVYIAN